MAYDIAKYLIALSGNRFRFTHPVRLVTYLVTFKCNLRCSMCQIPSIEHKSELTLSEIDKIFSQIGRLDAVRISGGEPFLRTDLPAVVDCINRRANPSRFIISSNGTIGSRMIDFVANTCNQPQSLHLEISLDGFGETHDRIRGKEGTFDQVFASLKELSKLRATRRFTLSVAQTIFDREGIAGYDQLTAGMEPLGISVFPNIAYDSQTALYTGPGLRTDPAAAYSYDSDFLREVEPFLKKVLRAKYTDRSVALAKRYYIQGVLNRLIAKSSSPNPPCTALYSHMRINPDGAVPVCMHNSRIIGSLREKPLKEIWKGPDARRERAWVDSCKGCWAGCEIIPNAMYSGDILRGLLIR